MEIPKPPYPKISEVRDIIEILDVLFPAMLPHNVHVAVSTLISCEYVMVWYNNDLLGVPNLQRGSNNQNKQG